MKFEFDGPTGPDLKWLRETVREVLSVACLWPASKLYKLGNRLSPQRLEEEPEDLSWQEETPEVSAYRQQMKIPTQQQQKRERTERGRPKGTDDAKYDPLEEN